MSYQIDGEPCLADYHSTGIGIFRNKASCEDNFRGEGKCLVSSVSEQLLYRTKKKMTIEGRALTKIVDEPRFVDYQSTGIGILRNKVSSEDSV